MTDRYVRSAGANSSPFTSWANAATTMAGAIAAAAAGDRFFVRSDHAEDNASGTWSFPGTQAAPSTVIGVSDSNEPATTPATGATFDTTTTVTRTVSGSVVISSCTIRAGGSGGNNATLLLCNSSGTTLLAQRYEDCTLGIRSTGTSSRIDIGNNASTSSKFGEFSSCTFTFGASAQGIRARAISMIARGCNLGGTSPTNLFLVVGDAGQGADSNVLLEACDLSSGGSAMNIINTMSGASRFTMLGCILPAAWSGVLVNNTLEPGGVARIVNCIISGGGKIRLWDQQSTGLLSDETTFIRTGGAQDEGTGISWKVVTTANVAWPASNYISPDIVYHNASTSSPVTLKIAVLIDSATPLTNQDIWLRASYLGTSSSPARSTVSSRCAILTAATNLASSSETWTTTGMSNPTKYELSVTFTPQVAGDVKINVCLAVASKTLYVCPKAYA